MEPAGGYTAALTERLRHIRVFNESCNLGPASRPPKPPMAPIGTYIGQYLEGLRDRLTHRLASTPIRPNQLTLLGVILTVLSGFLFAQLAEVWAGVVLLLAGACDAFDGALARTRGEPTPFGAIYDSTLDRYSDFFLFLGIALGALRALRPDRFGLALVVTMGALLTSYVRARAECHMERCSMGLIERPERLALVIIGAFTGHLDRALWILAPLTHLVVIQRLIYARSMLGPTPAPGGGRREKVRKLLLWSYPRMSWQYDIAAAIILSALVVPWP